MTDKTEDEVKIDSPSQVKEVMVVRHHPGYVYRKELIDGSEFGSEDMEMQRCYSSETGHWIGDPKMTKFLCNKKGLRYIQKGNSNHSIASIGFNEKEQKWYGWSHRAICGFGVGDKIFVERYGNDKTLFTKHGPKAIKNMTDAKTAAKRFAASVS